MNILAIIGLAILTAVLATLMRRYHKEYAMLLSVLGGGLILFMIFQNFTPALSSITEMPVSYTHLDVYKRQVRLLTWAALMV